MNNKNNIYKIYKKPFNHIVIENFLNKNISLKLKKNNLKQYAKPATIALKNPLASQNRLISKIIIKNKINPNLKKKHFLIYKNLFKLIKSKLDSNFFKDLKINKNSMINGAYNIQHVWDRPGFFMKPHVDTKKKIWTGIVYLFGDGYKPDGSTKLYGKKNVYKTVKPNFNKFLAFKRTKFAEHSVKTNAKKRELLLINYNKINIKIK